MRILEECAPSWPMPDVQDQINALREAFSADTSKPFQLKASFPLGSPATQPGNPSPVSASNGAYHQSRRSGVDMYSEAPGQVQTFAHPLTPPKSISDAEPRADSPVVQSLAMMAPGQRHAQAPTSVPNQESAAQWNPSPIFK